MLFSVVCVPEVVLGGVVIGVGDSGVKFSSGVGVVSASSGVGVVGFSKLFILI